MKEIRNVFIRQKTYTDANIENNWNALFHMVQLFKEEQTKLAKKLNLCTNTVEANNSIRYIEKIRYG